MTYKILVPIDTLDEHTAELANTINNLCVQADSHLQLLHVLPYLEDVDADEIEQSLGDANDFFTKFSELLNCPDGRIERHIQMGEPESEIIKRAIIQRADVIVMPTREKKGIDKLLLGSVTEHVIRHSRSPVVATRKRSDTKARADKEIAKILVPLDGTDQSTSIIPAVVDFAKIHKSEIILFHDEKALNEDEFINPDNSVAESFETVVQNIAKQGVDVRFETSYSVKPIEVILQKVEEFDVDMVAMTTHGRTGLSRMVFGSVVEEFMRKSDCPLLTISAAPTHSLEYEEKYLG